jgi:hypothetical protein
MADKPRNIGASVRARLQNFARENGTDFQLVLTRYVLERLLHRLSVSAHRDGFILKGALLYSLWLDMPLRGTRDLDLLSAQPQSIDRMAEIFREICRAEVPDDGVVFDHASLTAEAIRENASYGGVRITTTASLAGARIPVQVDLGFGDVVTPRPETITYPVLLDAPAPQLKAYPRETVIAEKLEAMVSLGLTNSRMKDFLDVAFLAKTFDFDGSLLMSAVVATFRRRGTPVPAEPEALTKAFVERPETIALWKAFITRETIPSSLSDWQSTIQILRSFMLPVVAAASTGGKFGQSWNAGGPWKPAKSA